MRTVKEIRVDLRKAEADYNELRDVTSKPVPRGGNFDAWNYAAVLQDETEVKVKALQAELAAHPETVALRNRKNAARRERHAALTSLGLKRVRGAEGGVYYE